MTIVAMKHGFTLLPEKIYINANGTINRDSMIDQVSNLFASSFQNIGHQDPSKSKTVEEFIEYAANINAFDFEKKYKRPMSSSERDSISTQAASSGGALLSQPSACHARVVAMLGRLPC